MRLIAYLAREGISLTEFARMIGVPSAETVRRYCLAADDPNRRIPRAEHMKRIAEATDGQVTANDFYGIASKNAAAEDAACTG